MSREREGDVSVTIGVDIGGTFTDCAVVADDGTVVTGKVPSTPANLSEGFFAAIGDAGGRLGLTMSELLQRASRVSHGTTTGLNALITGRTAKVVLVTTAGHADAIRLMNDRGRVQGA